jgi:hypothetical protein
MIGWSHLLLNGIAVRFRSKARLEAEVLILRHLVNVLRRIAGRRPRLTAWDRLVFVVLYRLCPQVLDAVAIVSPDTVIRWHRRVLRRSGAGSRGPEAAGRRSQGNPRPDPGDEPGQLVVGCASDPRRAAQARRRGRPIDRRQVHGQAPWTAIPDVEDIPAQPCGWNCRRGSVRRPDDRLQVALLSGHPGSRPAEARSSCRYGTPYGRVDCPADSRGFPVGYNATISGARSRCRLWPRREATAACAGHPGSTNCTAVAMAKRLRGAFDRFGTARMH